MAHFSASGDSIASVFITIRIGFERCTCMYLAAFVLLSPAFAVVARCCVSYHGYLSFDPFFIIVA